MKELEVEDRRFYVASKNEDPILKLNLAQMRDTIPLVQLCDSASRILSLLDKGVQSPRLKYISSKNSH